MCGFNTGLNLLNERRPLANKLYERSAIGDSVVLLNKEMCLVLISYNAHADRAIDEEVEVVIQRTVSHPIDGILFEDNIDRRVRLDPNEVGGGVR
jgi:hypothetical protein